MAMTLAATEICFDVTPGAEPLGHPLPLLTVLLEVLDLSEGVAECPPEDEQLVSTRTAAENTSADRLVRRPIRFAGLFLLMKIPLVLTWLRT